MPDLRLGRSDTALPICGPQGSQLSWPKQVVLSSVMVILFGDPQGTSLSALGLTNMWRVKTIYPSNKCLQSLAQCLALGTPGAGGYNQAIRKLCGPSQGSSCQLGSTCGSNGKSFRE